MSALATFAKSAWLTSNVPAYLAFRAALRDPLCAQLTLLRSGLERNSRTAYGRAHDFSGIRSYEEFKRRVPLVSYEDLAPWIDRIQRGEENVLTWDRVTHLIPTSGSTAARKLIPFTAGLQREFNRGIAPWIVDLYSRHRSLAFGSAYWAISPALSASVDEKSAVPIGFDTDSSYVGGARKHLVEAVTAVPSSVRLLNDMDAFRYATLLALLRRRDLRLISVWHPSFLTLLLDALPRYWDSLLEDVQSGRCTGPVKGQARQTFAASPMPKRAAELSRLDPVEPCSCWPHLRVISCWGDAHAKVACDNLRRRFPSLHIQSKGLLATEAFVTLPFANGTPLAVRSHFFEFVADDGTCKLAHELCTGAEYEVVVTTAGGLWRYRLGDRVRVTNFLGLTPCLEFIGRHGSVCDLRGEKLSEQFVASAVEQLLRETNTHASFAMLAPEEIGDVPNYTLFIETPLRVPPGARLDELLRANPHYAWCRDLGQLAPARLHKVTSGYDTFVQHELSRGKRLGEIKPCPLSPDMGWRRRFETALNPPVARPRAPSSPASA